MRNLNNTFRNPTPTYITLHASIQSHFLHKSSSDSLGSASHVTQIGSHFASETFRWFKVYFGYMIKGGALVLVLSGVLVIAPPTLHAWRQCWNLNEEQPIVVH
jgi:hypothetical protein